MQLAPPEGISANEQKYDNIIIFWIFLNTIAGRIKMQFKNITKLKFTMLPHRYLE